MDQSNIASVGRHSRPADFWADCTIDTSGFVRSAMPLLTVNAKNILAGFTALAAGEKRHDAPAVRDPIVCPGFIAGNCAK
jgi:hypothetical protein